MIFTNALAQTTAQSQAPAGAGAPPDYGNNWIFSRGMKTKAKQVVSPHSARCVASFYRGTNILSDDVAAMPLQQYRRTDGKIQQVSADPVTRNTAYLVGKSPNRWMTPFIFKKTVVMWLIFWGNGLIWSPPGTPRELFILPTSVTQPLFDSDSNLWYQVLFPNGRTKYIPAVEVLHLMINSTNGIWGRSVLEYAAETLGRQLGAYNTQSMIQGQGLNPAAYIQMAGPLDKAGRDNTREAYEDAISGAEGAGRLAVFDNKVVKFEAISMKMTDAQFLESIQATDKDIANFLGLPEYKLNAGKQSYQSNEQSDIDYLKTTLDPTYLVQWEEAAYLKWQSESEQKDTYFKFIRESVLRTSAKTRAELNEIYLRTRQRTPDEMREKDDYGASSDGGGDKFYLTTSYAVSDPDHVSANEPAPQNGATQ